MRRKLLQDTLFPDEVLEHLRRGFDEVSFDSCTSKFDVFRVSAHYVHYMAKLVEEGDNVRVGEERWHIFAWFGEVANTSSNRQLSRIRILRIKRTAALLESEASSMSIFTLARKEVEVEAAHKFSLERSSSSSVVNGEHSYSRSPNRRILDLSELEM